MSRCHQGLRVLGDPLVTRAGAPNKRNVWWEIPCSFGGGFCASFVRVYKSMYFLLYFMLCKSGETRLPRQKTI